MAPPPSIPPSPDVWGHGSHYRNHSDREFGSQMPECKIEFDGKETYVMCNGVALAFRRDNRWVSIEPGVTVRDIFEDGRHGIEVRYSRVTTH